ncbi:MAG: pyridoxal-phosphate dependent enzyme [Candidatus Lokiarchaeota archaeon]|nr:pyridoxal-phosphate dependent enzyme [Candidatus Lokiarchaeota archaeon]
MGSTNPLNIKDTRRPMLEAYPGIPKIVPWIPLMDGVPTPVQELDILSKQFPGHAIYIKRDDLSSSIYGGNKPRKFEFLFADAMAKKKDTMATAGGTGTNHGLASVMFSNALGLKSKVYMFKQPLTWGVQRKLLMYVELGAEIKLVANYGELAFRGLWEMLAHPRSYLMLPGGSPLFGLGTVAGCLGFVNAGFELAEQVKSGAMPEPDRIFIAAGSTGSVSGLILGCKLAGLKSKVSAVRVSANIVTNTASIQRNIRNTLKLMRRADPGVPEVALVYPGDFEFLDSYLGSEYGCVTRAGQDAVDLVNRLEGGKGFHLETTYTGKACAAMLDHLRAIPKDKGETALLWNTYNSRDLSHLVGDVASTYPRLPKAFHQFFDLKMTCWQYKDNACESPRGCPAFQSDDNRCWLVKAAHGQDTTRCVDCSTRKEIEGHLAIEDA